MISGGISWDKIHKMINESKKDGDPLANMISDMDIVTILFYFLFFRDIMQLQSFSETE
jgi:hypothetical protein